MHAYRLVGRQCPRCSRPDHRVHFGIGGQAYAKRFTKFYQVSNFKSHVDRGRGFVLVLDFGLGQRGLAIKTPVHRLFALIQITSFVNIAECANNIGFDVEIHGEVGMIPITQHAETDEVFLLALYLLCRIFTA